MKSEEGWRLLQCDAQDPRISLSVSEAIFRCKRAGLSPNTLCVWRTANPVVLFYSGTRHQISVPFTGGHSVEFLRTQAVAGYPFLCDAGSINFSIAVGSGYLKPHLQGKYRPLLSEYQFLLEFFAEGLRGFGIEVQAEPDGIYTSEGKEIATSQPAWLSDELLLQGTVYVNTEVKDLKLGLKREMTSLADELKELILPDEILGRVVQGIEEKFEMTFERKGVTDVEQRLASRLFETKYGTAAWNVEGKAPFLALTGETLVTLYVAYPPTSRCRQLIEGVNKAVSDLKEEVSVVVWKRGLGPQQHPTEAMPPVIITLSKANILPAVIINGEVKFALGIPPDDDLREAIHHPDKFPDILGSLYRGAPRSRVR